MKKEKKYIAVKVEGPFNEWYAPDFRNPYDTNAAYNEWYEANFDKENLPPSVFGGCFGDDEAYVSSDIECLCDRLTDLADEDDDGNLMDGYLSWDSLYTDIKDALNSGTTFTYTAKDGRTLKITPYLKDEMPPINEDSLKCYREYASLVRERMEEI